MCDCHVFDFSEWKTGPIAGVMRNIALFVKRAVPLNPPGKS